MKWMYGGVWRQMGNGWMDRKWNLKPKWRHFQVWLEQICNLVCQVQTENRRQKGWDREEYKGRHSGIPGAKIFVNEKCSDGKLKEVCAQRRAQTLYCWFLSVGTHIPTFKFNILMKRKWCDERNEKIGLKQLAAGSSISFFVHVLHHFLSTWVY